MLIYFLVFVFVNCVPATVHLCFTYANWSVADLVVEIDIVIWNPKLQALVYDILPLTTAIGPWKLSANEQFFVGAQPVVSLLQTTQIISDVYFITDHVAYASSNKIKIVWIETDPFILPGVDASHVYMRARRLVASTVRISTQTFWRALTTSVDSCAEIKNAPSAA